MIFQVKTKKKSIVSDQKKKIFKFVLFQEEKNLMCGPWICYCSKYGIFWPNICLRLYFDNYAVEFLKGTSNFYPLSNTKKIINLKKGIEGSFLEIYQKKFKIFPQTSINWKYGGFYSNNKLMAHTFSFGNFAISTELKSSSPS